MSDQQELDPAQQFESLFTETEDAVDLEQYSEYPPESNGVPQTPEEVNAALQQMIAPTRPEVPTIDPPPPGVVDLLLGITHNGQRYHNAVVRELNGADEEAISRLSVNSANYNVMIVEVHLRCAVISVGPHKVADKPDVLNDLIISDRDILFKEILLATYGKSRDYENVVCPTCGLSMQMHIDIEALIEVSNPRTFDSEKFTVELRDGRKVLMRYVTGKDQLAVFDSTSRSPSGAEANTAFIAACVLLVNGEPLADPEQWALDLGIADRRKIVDALLDVPAIGFKEVEVPCNRCGKNLPTVFGWADLLPG